MAEYRGPRDRQGPSLSRHPLGGGQADRRRRWSYRCRGGSGLRLRRRGRRGLCRRRDLPQRRHRRRHADHCLLPKLRSVRASSAFWANSPSSNNGTRGYQAHVPWDNANIYFDTSGCCDADITRINLSIDQFPGYTGDASWWQQWHHFAFVKAGAEKHIYIDGQLFHSGGGGPLKTDFTTLLMGGGPSATENRMDGYLDDFVIYNGALTEAQARSLSTGAAPSSIPGLIAHWDFNDLPPANVTLKAVRSGANVTITSEPAALPAGWVLQTAPSVNGPWTTQAGATTPVTVPIGAANAFLRAAKP
ncbi:MAG: LamG domain-containing protein [Verrucomicrobia bacterium]|nr:LamG domain-containing protein [Verrucomicrobiota bacterium]